MGTAVMFRGRNSILSIRRFTSTKGKMIERFGNEDSVVQKAQPLLLLSLPRNKG
jgi:hypothetical protein